MYTPQCEALWPISMAATVSRSLCALPAVATLDWCDRAAACLTSIADPCLAVVMIATLDGAGQIASLEAVGAGASLRSESGAGGTTRLAPTDPAILLLKARAARLCSVGFLSEPYVPGRTICAPASELLRDHDWRNGPLGRLWAGHQVADPLVGVAPLGEPGRVVIAVVAPALPAAQINDPGVRVLAGVLPILGDRALRALGPTRSGPRTWLTVREQEVLEQLVLGHSVKEIAEVLGRSPHTVHDHVKSLHKKLDASTRGELVARALGHTPEAAPDPESAEPKITCTAVRATPRATSAV